ncbi:RNA-directed DNA polymerase, eukaryota, reverse transcriptase zinc-binding domain protein [Tanacetum coccineum]|uniref:RNA-directed DNA polymerase, eukaryota, reverse transcriptase zinc-binding domain protein n=1 Tax=Tanacetum coccineum TaxID=301880 RepID=A0ABQ5J4M7_9ASTR
MSLNWEPNSNGGSKEQSSDDHQADKERSMDNNDENNTNATSLATANANPDFVSNNASSSIYTNSVNMDSYAKAVGINGNDLDKNLFFCTYWNERNGEEAVIFEEELVIEGSKKSQMTVCGYFVGCSMSPAEIRYWQSRICQSASGNGSNQRVFGHRESGYMKQRVNTVRNSMVKEKEAKDNKGKEKYEEGFIAVMNRKKVGNVNKIFYEEQYQGAKFYCTFVYASNSGYERRTLWKELEHQKNIVGDHPWFGAWGILMSSMELVNTLHVLLQTMDMQAFKETCTTLKKLDRMLVNEKFMDKYPKAFGEFLPFLISDHSPAVLFIKEGAPKKKKSFRFSNFITRKEEFIEIVKKEWDVHIQGSNMFKLVQKLKKLKHPLNKLSWSKGNLFNNVKYLKDKLKLSQENMINNPRDESMKKIAVDTLNEYTEAVSDELVFLKQKSKSDDVAKQFVKHFEEFLGTSKAVSPISPEIFTHTLSMEDAENMVREVSESEIKEVLFEIDGDKASGPDDNSFEFFKKAWNVIGEAFCLAAKVFFRSGKLLGEINATIIALIPKVSTPNKELLRGYNRKNGPKRCAMQIDIQKAYDTVNWNFMESALNNFGFHHIMVKWIMQCITSSKFSICLNGGLSANLGKSVIFFRSINDDVKRELLQILPFKCGKLPVRYLGVPLLAKRLSIQDCKVHIDKVENKIIYLLPSTVVNDIDKLFKRFLWNSGESAKGKAIIAWKVVCRPKEQGGLGIKPLKRWNEVLLIKQFWKILENKKSLWAEWVNMGWKTMMNIRDKIKNHIIYEVGNGNSVSLWYDKWCSNGPIRDFITQRNIYDARLSIDAKVSKMIKDNKWLWPDEWFSNLFEIPNIHIPPLNDQKDKVLWVTNAGHKVYFSTKSDSHDHLFFQCDFAKKVWREIWKVSYKFGTLAKLDDICRELVGRSKESKFSMVVDKLILAATVYYVWQERNRRNFKKEKRAVETICNMIKDCVKCKLMSLQVKKLKSVIIMMRKWELKWNNGRLYADLKTGNP